MVNVSKEAEEFIVDLLKQNDKSDYGIKVFVAGMACAGPQFGMKFQESKEEGDVEEVKEGFSLYYDADAVELLDGCVIDFIRTPEGEEGLVINNPSFAGCGSCSGCH